MTHAELNKSINTKAKEIAKRIKEGQLQNTKLKVSDKKLILQNLKAICTYLEIACTKKEVKKKPTKASKPKTRRLYLEIKYKRPNSIATTLIPMEKARIDLTINETEGAREYRIVNNKDETIQPSTDGNFYFVDTTGRRAKLTPRIIKGIVDAVGTGKTFEA